MSKPRVGMLARSGIQCALLTAGFVLGTAVQAEPLAEADATLRKGDVAGAVKVLETAADAGNLAAKGRLAGYLLNLPAPYKDAQRACRLAIEAAEAGEAYGKQTRAECLIAGVEKSEQPYDLARELARDAQKAGVPAAGFTLYQAYVADPKYDYSPGGKVDKAKYDALAATPLAQRGEQIEAFEGLASANRVGHVNALYMTLAFLSGASAPSNIDRILGLANLLQKSGQKVPDALMARVRLAQQIKGLGTTHASPTAFRDAYSAALLAAMLKIRGVDASVCDADKVKLVRVAADPVSGAEYLPVAQPLANTYLVRGSWSETWAFSGCDKRVVVNLDFSADGWSGARFKTGVASVQPAGTP